MEHLASALIIRAEPLAKILHGRKVWEMRGRPIAKRGLIGLIEKGSKSIVGVAELVDCRGPLSREEMLAASHLHGIEPARVDEPQVANWRYAWVLDGARRLRQRVPYVHTSEVQWVSLTDSLRQAVERSMI